jgi:hypothetical protein
MAENRILSLKQMFIYAETFKEALCSIGSELFKNVNAFSFFPGFCFSSFSCTEI